MTNFRHVKTEKRQGSMQCSDDCMRALVHNLSKKKKTKLNEILQVKSHRFTALFIWSVYKLKDNTQKNEKPTQTPQTPLALLALFNGTAASAYSKALEAFDIVLVK